MLSLMADNVFGHGALARAIVAITATLSLVVGALTAVVAVRLWQVRDIGTEPGWRRTVPSGTPTPPAMSCSELACNYLLLGSDSRAGLSPEEQERFGTDESIGGTSRADTIMLVHVDPRLEDAIVLSFPRDLWVEIPGRGRDRINTAFEGGLKQGGPQLMAQTITDLTGLEIDHYLHVDLEGFKRIVDTLGGIDICIPAYNVNTPGWLTATSANGEPVQVYYDDVGHIADPDAGLNIEPGCQRLAGDQALAYVRARHLPCDHIPDFSRIGRQQQFLRAVLNQMLQPTMAVKAPALVSPILASLRRDPAFATSDLIYLAGRLRGLTSGAVEFRSVPGLAAQVGAKSVLRMDPSANQIFAAIRRGGPIGSAGTQLVETPPSEANTTVAVVDAGSGDTAAGVQAVLADAGFDITPGIWPRDETPTEAPTSAIVFRPATAAHAQVVSAYFPDLPLVASAGLRDAHVAIVVNSSYELVDPGEAPGSDGASECPSPAA